MQMGVMKSCSIYMKFTYDSRGFHHNALVFSSPVEGGNTYILFFDINDFPLI